MASKENLGTLDSKYIILDKIGFGKTFNVYLSKREIQIIYMKQKSTKSLYIYSKMKKKYYIHWKSIIKIILILLI